MNFERNGEIKKNTTTQNLEALSKLQKHIHPITLQGKETHLEVQNNVWLAPLAGVTDLPFRLVCKNSPYFTLLELSFLKLLINSFSVTLYTSIYF